MTIQPRSDRDSTSPDRLDGWKEIAAHFRKGVRTVQRWEKELGLPVRRMGTGRGEVVFALRSELDGWRSTVEKGADLADLPGDEAVEREPPAPVVEPAPGSQAVSRRKSWRWAGLAGLAVVAVLASWLAFGRPARQPSDARVEHGRLQVYDQDGRVLWQYAFSGPLSGSSSDAGWIAPIVADIDRDGDSEVVFATSFEISVERAGVYCFERSGALRFHHNVTREVSFGGIPAPGPWHPVALALTRDEQGNGEIWLSSMDSDQFPSVLEKIDPRGRVVGEFWNPGTVTALLSANVSGRPVMVAGGSSNEHNGSALAVLDRRNPTGTAPALLPKFTCQGCPSGQPLAYLVLPGTEIERLQDNTSGVESLRAGDRGVLTAVIRHGLYFDRLGKGRGVMLGTTKYIFAPDLAPLSAQHQPDFRVMHDEAFKQGILDHPFGPADDAALFPIRRWDGSRFEEVAPTGKEPKRTSSDGVPDAR